MFQKEENFQFYLPFPGMKFKQKSLLVPPNDIKIIKKIFYFLTQWCHLTLST